MTEKNNHIENQEEDLNNDANNVSDTENVNDDNVSKTEETADENAKDADETYDKQRKHKGRHASDKELEELKAANAELNDKYIRLLSEFDNFRKRTAKEKLEMTSTASANVIKDILPVLDDFERAIGNIDGNGDNADFQGFILIYNKLKSILKNKGLEEIDAMGADFNTDEHEALTLVPAPDESKKGKVLDVVQKGYRLNGQVLRFARVVVGN